MVFGQDQVKRCCPRWDHGHWPSLRGLAIPAARNNTVNSFVAKHRSEINGVLECFDRVILQDIFPSQALATLRLGYSRSKSPSTSGNSKRDGGTSKRRALVCRDVEGSRSGLQSSRAAPTGTYHVPSGWRITLANWPAKMASLTDSYVPTGRWRIAVLSACSIATTVPRYVRTNVCLVIYFYWMDCEFGLMHVKIQTWFPFTMQVYVNGHEWLAKAHRSRDRLRETRQRIR